MTHSDIVLHLLNLARTNQDCFDQEIERLIQSGEANQIRSRIPNEGSSLLTLTIEKGWDQAALRLIESGVDVNHPSEHGYTPMHAASAWKKTNLLEALLKHGAKADVKTHDGVSPLHFVLSDHAERTSVAVLLECYSDAQLFKKLTQKTSKHPSVLAMRTEKHQECPLDIFVRYFSGPAKECVEILNLLEDRGIWKKLEHKDASEKEKEIWESIRSDLTYRVGDEIETWVESRVSRDEQKQLQHTTPSVPSRSRSRRL